MTGFNPHLSELARLDLADLMGRYLRLAGRGTGTGPAVGSLEAKAAVMTRDALMAALLEADERKEVR